MTAELIPFNKPAPPDPKCSFCGVKKSRAKHMFQSNEKCICDKCVIHAKERITGDDQK